MIGHIASLGFQAVALMSVLAASSVFAAEPHTVADLTGEWILNEIRSDDPASVVAALHQSGGGSGHGPWMHMGGGGGSNPEHMRKIRLALEPPARVTIAQNHDSVTFTEGSGRSRTVATNDRKQKVQLDGRTVQVRAKWVDGRLVHTTFLGDGIKLTETYSVSGAPRQLHVFVDLDASKLPQTVSLRRVYDAPVAP